METINTKYGTPGHEPVHYLERHVPLHERIAFYTVADVAVVTATRDGMNLVPYEYVVCRQGPEVDDVTSRRESMLVVSGGWGAAGGNMCPLKDRCYMLCFWGVWCMKG